MAEKVEKKITQITDHSMLNEAFEYDKPSAFSRGLRVDLGQFTMLFLSGTASVGAAGETVHPGDFEAQCLRMYENFRALLKSEGADWKDVVKVTVYLADMSLYDRFNIVRTKYFDDLGVSPYPASTGIEAKLCRPELMIEMDGTAII